MLRRLGIQLFRERLSEKRTRQSRKVFWVVLSSLFFKEMTREAMDMCLRVLKESSIEDSTATVSGTAYWPIISHITFRDCRKHIFSDHLSRNSCKCQARKCFPPLLLSRDRLASLTNNGVNGHHGLPGRDGRDGAKRENCVVGPPGPRREEGEMGPSGTATDHRNWKQRAWQNSDGRDTC